MRPGYSAGCHAGQPQGTHKGYFFPSAKPEPRAERPPSPSVRLTYWFAKEGDDAKVKAQVLDDEFIPVGMQEVFDRNIFLKRFTLEPEVWYQQVTQRLIMGEKYRQTSQLIEAQIEYKRILSIDEDNIRANFGLGLVYLAQNEAGKAALRI